MRKKALFCFSFVLCASIYPAEQCVVRDYSEFYDEFVDDEKEIVDPGATPPSPIPPSPPGPPAPPPPHPTPPPPTPPPPTPPPGPPAPPPPHPTPPPPPPAPPAPPPSPPPPPPHPTPPPPPPPPPSPPPPPPTSCQMIAPPSPPTTPTASQTYGYPLTATAFDGTPNVPMFPTGAYSWGSAAGLPDPDALPLVITNTTGNLPTDVYLVVYGQVPACPYDNTAERYVFITYDADGKISGAVPISDVQPNTTTDVYSYPLSYFTSTIGQETTILLPPLDGGRVYFSLNAALPMTLAPNSISPPSPTPPASGSPPPSYTIVNDKVEFTYLPGPASIPTGQLSPDSAAGGCTMTPACTATCSCGLDLKTRRNAFSFNTTAVDFYGLSMYLYMYDACQGKSATTGIYFSRECVLDAIQTEIDSAPTSAQSSWQSLILTDSGNVLRVLSPKTAIAAPLNPSPPPYTNIFPPDYLDNPIYSPGNNYTWAGDVWNSSTAYYLNHTLTVTIPIPPPSGSKGTFTATYQGTVQLETPTAPPPAPSPFPSAYYFVFQQIANTGGLAPVTYYGIPWIPFNFSPPDANNFPSSSQFFFSATAIAQYMASGTTSLALSPAIQTDPSDVVAQNLCQALTAAFDVGVLPTPGGVITQSYINNLVNLPQGTALPYVNSSVLSLVGQSSGPWYNLYSKAIHQMGVTNTTATYPNVTYTFPWDDYIYTFTVDQTTFNVAPGFNQFTSGTFIGVDLRPLTN